MICDAHVHFFSPGFFDGLGAQMGLPAEGRTKAVVARAEWQHPESVEALADRWIVTDDGQSYIFRLRDGTWLDGSPLTAASARAALLAAIAGAKRTPDLVPLCHPIALHGVTVDLEVTDEAVEITATARTADRTGVEMEALTSVAVAGLTVIDMVKAVDPRASITDVRLLAKSGGKSGEWTR